MTSPSVVQPQTSSESGKTVIRPRPCGCFGCCRGAAYVVFFISAPTDECLICEHHTARFREVEARQPGLLSSVRSFPRERL